MTVSSRFERSVYWGCGALFLALSILILVSVPHDRFVDYAADGSTWIDPALGLVRHGAFVAPNDPSILMNSRPPTYPLLVALGMEVGGERNFAGVVVSIQIALLLGTAAIAAICANMIDRRLGLLVFPLLLFNPNSFGTAFFVQSETLNAFFVSIVFLGLFLVAVRGSVWFAVLSGAAVGLVALTRPEARFLVFLVPFAILLLSKLGAAKPGWRRGVLAGALCLTTTLVAAAPWMAWNYSNGVGYRLTASGNTEYYVWDSVAQIEMEATHVSESEAVERTRAIRDAFIEGQGGRWQTLSPEEQDDELARAGLLQIASYPVSTIAKNITKATLQFFSGAGSGRIFSLIGMPNASAYAIMAREKMSNHADAVFASLEEGTLVTLSVWTAAFGYVVLLRIFGLIGLWWLLKEKRYDLLLLLVSGILYYALVIPFYGISRFRVSVECLLVLLAALGALAAFGSRFSLAPRRQG